MSTLIQKAQHILDEKNSKIIPTNIKDGVQIFDIEGTLKEGIDTSDATATENDLVKNTTAYVNGVKLEGALAERRGQHARVGLDTGYNLTRNDNDGLLKFDIHKFESAGSIPDEMAIDNDTTFSGDLDYSDIVVASGLRANIIKKNETILGVTGTLETSGTDTSDATATENDLVADTTAYVNGVKITGKLFDNRNSSGYNEINGTQVRDFTDAGYLSSGGYIKKLPNYLSGVVFSDEVLVEVKMPYSTITEEIGLTANKLKRGETILGITGTLDTQGTDTSDATATANDIVENTTAYVDGVKLTGNIIDGRTHNIEVGLSIKKIEDNSGTELVVDMNYVPEDSLKPNLVVNGRTPFQVSVQYEDMVDTLNITSDMIRVGNEILGVTGTYSGSSIVYLEPGDEIHINMSALRTALFDAVDSETLAQVLWYDSDGEDLFTAKLMDCVNLGQPYNHSGIGLVMDGTTTYLKIYSWDPATNTNTLQSSNFIELVSGSYPEQMNFDVSSFVSILQHLGGYNRTDLTFTYPSNAPIIPLINDNTVKLLTQDGCDIGEVLTFNLPSTYIRIVKAG